MTNRKNQAASALDISNVVAAFSEEQVERMVGLTKSRLRYWAKTDFFSPSFVEEDGHLPYSRFYSFKDVVALRTLEMLRVRNGVPLQHLRKVAEKLTHLKDELWTSTTLFVNNKQVAIVNSESHQPREVLTGQYVLGLSKVIEDTRNDVVAFRSRPADTFGHLSRNRGIVRNSLVVSGTRIPVSSIVRLHEDGFTVDQIIEEYPDLTPEDVHASLQHGKSAAA